MVWERSNMRQMFEAVATRYDFLNHVLSFNMDRMWRRRLVELAEIRGGERVLDLCTGTGDIALEFASRTGVGSVTAVDFSPRMLALAGEKIARKQCGRRIDLVESDVLRLPFAPASFDVVSIGFGLRNLVEYKKGLAAMALMLRPGGRFVMLELAAPDRSLFGRLVGFHLAHVLIPMARFFGDPVGGYGYLSSSVRGFVAPATVQEWISSAGFEAVRCLPLSLGIAHAFSGRLPLAA